MFTEKINLLHGDCLELMLDITSSSVDLVLCDLPYEKTNCKWDKQIPFEKLWPQYLRVCKPNAAIILTAIQPFTSLAVISNPKMFKYDLVWEKTSATGHLNAKKMPMRAHESVLIFCAGRHTYNPIKSNGHIRKTAIAERFRLQSECYGKQSGVTRYDSTERYPRSVIKFSSDKQKSCLHPTQKPLALMEWLIKTYSNEGDLVLDNAMGSGTTGLACKNLGRRFIGIEKDRKHFITALKRISN